MAKQETQTLLGDWQEPTGVGASKKGSRELYRYVYDKGAGRFVNTNKACRGCPDTSTCYTGKHALVAYCSNNPNPTGK